MNTRNTLSFANFAAVCSTLLLAGALSAQSADAKAPARDVNEQKAHYYKKKMWKERQAQDVVGAADGGAADGERAGPADASKKTNKKLPPQDYLDQVELERSDVLPAAGSDAPARDGDAQKAHYIKKKQYKEQQAQDDAGMADAAQDTAQDTAGARGADTLSPAPMKDSDQLDIDQLDEGPVDSVEDGPIDSVEPAARNKPLPREGRLELSMDPVDGGLSLTLRRDGEELWIGAILGALDSRTVTFGELPAVLGRSTVLAAGIVSQDSLNQQISVDLRHGGFDWVGFYVQGVAFTLEGAQATGIEKAGFRDQDMR